MASSYVLIAALVMSVFTIFVFLVSMVKNVNRIRYKSADTLTTIIYEILLLDLTAIFLIGAAGVLILFSLQVHDESIALELPGGSDFCLNRIQINTLANEALSTIIDLVLLQAVADRTTNARFGTIIKISSMLIVFNRATVGFIATLNVKATTTSIFDNGIITACLIQSSLGDVLLVATSALDIILAISSMAVFLSKATTKVAGLDATKDPAFRRSVASLAFHTFRIVFQIGNVVYTDLSVAKQQQLYAAFSLGLPMLLILIGLAFAENMDPDFLDKMVIATLQSTINGRGKTRTAQSSIWGPSRSSFWDRVSRASSFMSVIDVKDAPIRRPSRAATDNKPPLRIDTQRSVPRTVTAVQGPPARQQRRLHEITPTQGTMTIEHPITQVRVSKARQGRPPPTPGPSGPRKLSLAHKQDGWARPQLPPIPTIPEKYMPLPRPKEINRVASGLAETFRSTASVPREDSPTLKDPKVNSHAIEKLDQDEHQITIAFAGIDGAGSTPSNSQRGSNEQTSSIEYLPRMQYTTVDLSMPGSPPKGPLPPTPLEMPLPPTPLEMPAPPTSDIRPVTLSSNASANALIPRSMFSPESSRGNSPERIGRDILRGPSIVAMGDGMISVGQVVLQPVRINGAQRVIQPSRFVEVRRSKRGTEFKNEMPGGPRL